LAGTGSGEDLAFNVALDSSGYTYVVGSASSLDFPVTTGVSNSSAGKAFVAKFDTTQSLEQALGNAEQALDEMSQDPEVKEALTDLELLL